MIFPYSREIFFSFDDKFIDHVQITNSIAAYRQLILFRLINMLIKFISLCFLKNVLIYISSSTSTMTKTTRCYLRLT